MGYFCRIRLSTDAWTRTDCSRFYWKVEIPRQSRSLRNCCPTGMSSALFHCVFPHPDEARTGDIATAVSPNQVTVAVTPEADAVFDAFSELAYQSMITLGSKGNPSNYLWGKAFQNARRIALIIAAGVDIASPIVTE